MALRSEPVAAAKITLADLVDRVLDKGLVLNADIQVSLCGVELLGIRIRAALASFETAARYGLEWPCGTRLQEWVEQKSIRPHESCPDCRRWSPRDDLLGAGCPWCGWQSPRALAAAAVLA